VFQSTATRRRAAPRGRRRRRPVRRARLTRWRRPTPPHILRDADARALVSPDAYSTAAAELLHGWLHDLIQYNLNAPVSNDGGAGYDKLHLLAPSSATAFVVNDRGVFGAGLNVHLRERRSVELDGLEGEDHFTNQSTPFASRPRGRRLGNDISTGRRRHRRHHPQDLDGHGQSSTTNHCRSDAGYDGLAVPASISTGGPSASAARRLQRQR